MAVVPSEPSPADTAVGKLRESLTALLQVLSGDPSTSDVSLLSDCKTARVGPCALGRADIHTYTHIIRTIILTWGWARAGLLLGAQVSRTWSIFLIPLLASQQQARLKKLPKSPWRRLDAFPGPPFVE